jgi:hypothetical protein
MAKDMAYSVKRQQVLRIFVWSLKNFSQETVILWYTFLSAHVVSTRANSSPRCRPSPSPPPSSPSLEHTVHTKLCSRRWDCGGGVLSGRCGTLEGSRRGDATRAGDQEVLARRFEAREVVTPRVSNPHDYANHMFKRQFLNLELNSKSSKL